jgi:membrane protease YdiL (CAAX protease family)
MSALRRGAVLAAPAVVPASMAVLLHGLSRRLSPRAAYNVGFTSYWLVWCMGFPMWILGPRRAARLLIRGQRPSARETLLLLLPVAGAVTCELLPNRKKIDMPVALVMAATGVINGTGEELLWRGLFLEVFPNDPLRGLLWPLVGFSLWHLAPQMILPSRLGRWPFLLGAALVGSASAFSAWRSGGLKNCLAPHVAIDSCGVTAARFRLGR